MKSIYVENKTINLEINNHNIDLTFQLTFFNKITAHTNELAFLFLGFVASRSELNFERLKKLQSAIGENKVLIVVQMNEYYSYLSNNDIFLSPNEINKIYWESFNYVISMNPKIEKYSLIGWSWGADSVIYIVNKLPKTFNINAIFIAPTIKIDIDWHIKRFRGKPYDDFNQQNYIEMYRRKYEINKNGWINFKGRQLVFYPEKDKQFDNITKYFRPFEEYLNSETYIILNSNHSLGAHLIDADLDPNIESQKIWNEAISKIAKFVKNDS